MTRRATLEDAEPIARVHIRSWQRAYRHIFPPEKLDALSIDRRIEAWVGFLRRDDVGIFVNETEGAVTGFVGVGASRDVEGEGELYAIYVDPEQWSTGTGRALIAVGEEWLRSHGYGRATLWVLSDNPRARRFYDAAGWSTDGVTREGEHLGVQTHEVRYGKPLITGSPRDAPPT